MPATGKGSPGAEEKQAPSGAPVNSAGDGKGGGAAVAVEAPPSITTAVAKAVAKMQREKIGALVVSGDGIEVAGIVTERDVLHGLVEHGSELLERRVADLMSRDVITASLDDDAGTLMTVMTEHRCPPHTGYRKQCLMRSDQHR